MKCAPTSVPFLLGLVLAACASAGHPPPETETTGATAWSLGSETQLYPAGAIASAHLRYPLTARDSAYVRGGYNFTDRRDFGEHDDEEGGGPGFGLGYRRSFSGWDAAGWLAGVRLDLFFLHIAWKDDIPPRSGNTEIVVLQPAAEVGYGWPVGTGRLELTASLGAEINVDTDGEDVGEGAIGLLGLTWLPGR